MQPKDYLWFAVDVPSLEEAKRLVGPLIDLVPNVKVGLELITAVGPAAVKYLQDLGVENIWYGADFAGATPTTVGAASRSAANLGVSMFTVHPSCGALSLQAAVRNKGTAKALVTTVPAHVGYNDLVGIGYPTARGENISRLVEHMAEFAYGTGMNGVVCSPKELDQLCDNELLEPWPKYVIGVRPKGVSSHEHKRWLTPGEAVRRGAAGFAMGRPITNPPPGMSRRDVILRVYDEIAGALAAVPA